jgi:hypothetical protein
MVSKKSRKSGVKFDQLAMRKDAGADSVTLCLVFGVLFICRQGPDGNFVSDLHIAKVKNFDDVIRL